MRTQFFDRVATLEGENATFAIATVVGRRAPVSSHLGDRAIIFGDGRMEGFVGGSCSRDIVRRQALGVLATRQPVLLQIRNAAPLFVGDGDGAGGDGDGASADGMLAGPQAAVEATVSATERVIIPMSCASEGAVDVYIEPRVPLRRLVIVGLTPVAEALAKLASALDFAVGRVVIDEEMRDVGKGTGDKVLALGELRDFIAAIDASERRSLVAIVASQGHYDELALQVLESFDISFLGLVASRRRAATVFGVLAQQGVPADRLAMVRNPVGLDIGARTPGEVAVSILAEIIANAPSVDAGGFGTAAASLASIAAVDPVCRMDVETESALYVLEYAGQMYFFCCAGCRASFSADPARFLIALGKA